MVKVYDRLPHLRLERFNLGCDLDALFFQRGDDMGFTHTQNVGIVPSAVFGSLLPNTGNSGSSSKNSTPRWARLTSPGFTFNPPPVSAAIDAEWCGERNGRVRVSFPPDSVPATDATIETSSASAASSGGNM